MLEGHEQMYLISISEHQINSLVNTSFIFGIFQRYFYVTF